MTKVTVFRSAQPQAVAYETLRRITDFAGTGKLDVKGSISWSTFDALRTVPMVSFAK